MAFGGLEIASVTRLQDYSIIKQNEDNRSALQQSEVSVIRDAREETQSRQVVDADHTEWTGHKFDASEEGNGGAYGGDGGRGRKKKEAEQDGKVILKGRPTGFDLKI